MNTKAAFGPRVLPKLPQKGTFNMALNTTDLLKFLIFTFTLTCPCLTLSVALRKIDTIHLPSMDKSGPDVLQKPPHAQDTPPTRASDTITRPTEPPPKIPQPAERSQPLEVPQKPHISDLPPKPQLSDLPPKPQLSDLPPKPQLSDLPPKPQLKDLPPKPQLSDLPSKPMMSPAAETTQRQTTQEETSPKPQLTEVQSSSQQEELSPRQASEDTNGAPAGAVEMPVPMPRKINTVVSERYFRECYIYIYSGPKKCTNIFFFLIS